MIELPGERYRFAPRWMPRSLLRQLLLGVLSVVSITLIVLGVVSVMSLRSYVTTMNDALVAESLRAFNNSYGRYMDGKHPFFHETAPPVDRAMLEFGDQTPGNVIALIRDGAVVGSALFSEDEPRPLPPDVVKAIQNHTWTDGPAHTMCLDKLGSYRVDSLERDGSTLVVGVSLELANRILARKTITTVALIVGTLVVMAALTMWVVRYTLRPLRRAAATAAAVAAMPLADDDQRINLRVNPKHTDPGNEGGIVGHTLNQLLDNVDNALASRAESDLRMRQFLSEASHELRTPLAAILGYAELTRQDSFALPPTTEYALARIESEGRRMSVLVDQLLLLSRLSEGEGLLTDPVELNDLVSTAVDDAAVSAPTRHWIKLLPEGPTWVIGDRHRLYQVISNLLSNAQVHTGPGVTVTVSIRQLDVPGEGPFVELTVADDGPGIPPDLLPRVFDRFARHNKSRSGGEGNGLGLAIVSTIVAAHHGTVTAESADGHTLFRVTLPASIKQPTMASSHGD